MLPYIQIILPFYVVFTVIGLLAAFVVLFVRARKYKVGLLKLIQLTAVVSIGVFVGSKLLFVLTKLPEIISDFSVDKLISTIIYSGFVFYGGLFGAIAAAVTYAKARKMNTIELMNMLVPCIPLFHCFGRLGCFMSGCCYGIPFPIGFAMFTDPNVIRFPVQLTESLCNVIIFIVLLCLERKRANISLLKVYLLMYSICRFSLEFLRGDVERGIWLGLSTSQWISLGILLYLLINSIINKHKRRTTHENE